MEEDEFFEGIDPDELIEERPEPKWRRPLLIVMGVFLAVLVISLSFSDMLQGVIQSSSIETNRLVFRNATVLFENDALELLQKEFIDNEHREIKACLYGEQDDTIYTVDKVEFPRVLSASVTHVAAIPCPVDALIDLHSHPINRCLASVHDVNVHERRQEANPGSRLMIMCSSTRFAMI
jgi:hypothetical protein